MVRKSGVAQGLAALAAMGVMLVALWAWARSLELTLAATHPEVACWALRSAAIAAAAGAQLLFLTFVAGAMAGRGPAEVAEGPPPFRRDGLRIAIGVVASVALVSAIALGLAGR
jgi:hypothetical protein